MRFLNFVIMSDEVYGLLGKTQWENKTKRETTASPVVMWIQQNDRQAACRDIQVLPQYHVVPFGAGFLFYSKILEEITCYKCCLDGIHNNGTDNEYLIQISGMFLADQKTQEIGNVHNFRVWFLSEIFVLSTIFLRQWKLLRASVS